MVSHPLQDAVKQFLKYVGKIEIPPGQIHDELKDALGPKGFIPGTRLALVALAKFIDQHQDLVSIDGNKSIIERLRTTDRELNLMDIIIDGIMLGKPEEMNVQGEKLKRALRLNAQEPNVLEAACRAMDTIIEAQSGQLNDSTFAGMDNEPSGKPKPKGKGPDVTGLGTWKDSVADTGLPPISDDEISKAARAFDASGQGVDEAGIKRSSQEGKKEFTPSASDMNDYEKQEHSGDKKYLGGRSDAMREMLYYGNMAHEIRKAFDATIGAQLGMKSSIAR